VPTGPCLASSSYLAGSSEGEHPDRLITFLIRIFMTTTSFWLGSS
jgi:hypothetical protein